MRVQTFHIANYLTSGEAFHFARKHLETGPPRILHTHDFLELFVVERGSAQHWINGERTVVEAGMLVCIRAGDTHAFQTIGEEPCRIINVMFRETTARHLIQRYADDIEGRFFWKTGVLPDQHQLQGPQIERVVNMALELQSSRRSLAKIESFLLNVMTRVVDLSVDVNEQTPAWLVAACQAARQPEVFRKGAAGFVEMTGRVHEHVCRVTRQHLGVSPSAYINRMRMEHAAMMLGGTDDSITNIALECGIENLSHFYRTFRAHYGTTPRLYRQRHQIDMLQPKG